MSERLVAIGRATGTTVGFSTSDRAVDELDREGWTTTRTRGMSLVITSSDLGTEAHVSGTDQLDVMRKVETLRRMLIEDHPEEFADGGGI